MGELADVPEENFTAEYHFFSHWQAMVLTKGSFRERWEHRVFEELLRSVPGLEERLLHGSEEEVDIVAELVSFFVPLKHRKLIPVQ